MQFLVTRTKREIDSAYDRLRRAKILGCDTETGGLDPKSAPLFSVQFSDGEFHILIPTSEGIGLGKLRLLLEENSITKVFHNARFDLGFLRANGYFAENVYDTMIAERVLTSGADQSVSLAETLYRYFAVDLDKSQRKKFGKNWDKVWTNELVEYALNDVLYLPKLMAEQTLWMEKLDLIEEYKSKMKSICNHQLRYRSVGF